MSDKPHSNQLPQEGTKMEQFPPPPPGPPPGHSGPGSQEQHFPPPPPGPPPGHNGLAMNPHTNKEHETAIPHQPDAANAAFPAPPSEELYDEVPLPAKQTVHQPPPPEPTLTEAAAAPKKAGWGRRLSVLGSKAAAPFNMLANKIGSEAFLPTTMDKECEKAARILKSFCKDGIYTETNDTLPTTETETGSDGKPKPQPKKNRTLLTIPSKVINKAVGLAIFTTARAGFHISGSSGSGIIIARLPDGSWSPPSGIQVHSVGAGFMIGIDIYDCVVVINTREALAAFTKTRMSLGSDLAVVAGPWGAGGSVDFAAPSSDKGKGKATATDSAVPADVTAKEGSPVIGSHTDKSAEPQMTTSVSTDPMPTFSEPVAEKTATGETCTPERPDAGKGRKPSALKQAIKQPTYSYVKSRGFYAGVQVDGTVVTERKDANAAFYGEKVGVDQILKGEVPLVAAAASWPNAVKPLFDVVKGAEGWHAAQGQQIAATPPTTAPHDLDRASPSAAEPTATSTANDALPTRPTRTLSVAERVQQLNRESGSPTPAEPPNWKEREAAAEAEENRQREHLESMAPPYSEFPPGGEDQIPAYVDDGQVRPNIGDTKGAPRQ